jgi:dTDP-4-amino-4,6-dideoxygalactose transaminase
MKDRVYLSPPHMSGLELDRVGEAFDTNWIAPLGPHVDAFERELANQVGVRGVAVLASGTSAIHLALILAGVGPGDDVLCSTLTFVASANPIVYSGARPIFVDSDFETWTIDPDLVTEELKRRSRNERLPKALVAVDLNGQCADYSRLEPLCMEYGVVLIEDAAESLGSTAFGRAAGSFGDYGILSFNGNKIITTSAGGALVSNDTDAIARARFLATQARDPASHYEHSQIGYNYRMSNVLAGIGRAQLSVLEDRVAARRANFARYEDGLQDLIGLSFMPEAPYGRTNRWLTTVTINPVEFGATRDDIRIALEEHNIEARPLWKPMHLQPVFEGLPRIGGQVSETLFGQGLCLPSGSSLTTAQLNRIVAIIREVAQQK